MADFQKIDTKAFLSRVKTPDKTDKTHEGVRDTKTIDRISVEQNRQNRQNPELEGIGGLCREQALTADKTENKSFAVGDDKNGFVGFVGASETHEKQKSVALTPRPDTIPRLPFDLERLISAASNERLELNLAGVHDPNRYVMGWACAYLTGDRQHALQMLRQAQQARVTN